MKHLRQLLLLSVSAGLLLIGCDSLDTSPEALPDEADPAFQTELGVAPASTCTTLLGYEVCLTKVEQKAGTTVFNYRVRPIRPSRDLNHLVIEYPACTPALQVVDLSPQGNLIKNFPPVGIGGVKFDTHQRKQETKYHAITFAGTVATGTVRVGAKAGPLTETKTVAGASCDRAVPIETFTLTGKVYVESDDESNRNYGTKESNERGIRGVTVLQIGRAHV